MNPMRCYLFCVALSVLFCGCGSAVHSNRDTAVQGGTLPISRVVLYQNGIGYFEREGRIETDVLELQVRNNQINDLLKSLTVIDSGSGKALAVSLPLEKTGSQILDELPEQVRDAGGLLDILRVFRGANVVVKGKQGTVKGRIIGVEAMSAIGAPDAEEDELKLEFRATLKRNDGALVMYPVNDIEQMILQDRSLEIGLEKSLDVSLNEGNWKPSTLSIQLTDEGTHQVSVSYIIEMPKWKPAYRIVLADGKAPLLQGWAVVDNVSGEDWNNVELSLVAGTPMSFIYDLHSPRFIQRVDLTPSDNETAMAPVIEKPGYAPKAEKSKKDKLQRSVAAKRVGGSGFVAEEMDEADYDEEMDSAPEPIFEGDRLRESLASQDADAEGAQLGALFRYDLAEPVSVPDRTSTLVSIVNAEVPGKEVVLFRPELTRHMVTSFPYRAVMFQNETGFDLESGPVATYASNTFVGEGFLERMKEGQTAFLTFSIDGNVFLQRSHQQVSENTRLQKIIDGRIVTEAFSVDRSTYTIENHHDKTITAFVKVSKKIGSTLRNKPDGTVEAGGALFLPIDVKSSGKEELLVEWVSKITQTITIDTDLSTEVLNMYMSEGSVPEAAATALKSILELKAKQTELLAQVHAMEKDKKLLSDDQARIRDNLNILRKTKGNIPLQKQLAQKLGDIEKSLGKISGKLVRLSEEDAVIQAKMRVLIRGVTIKK